MNQKITIFTTVIILVMTVGYFLLASVDKKSTTTNHINKKEDLSILNSKTRNDKKRAKAIKGIESQISKNEENFLKMEEFLKKSDQFFEDIDSDVNKELKTSDLQKDTRTKNSWQELEDNTKVNGVVLAREIVDATKIKFNNQIIDDAKNGQNITITVGGSEYTATVSSKDDNTKSTTVTSHISNNEQKFLVSFTRSSAGRVYGTISTPSGEYEMQTNEKGEGWVYSTKPLGARIDTTISDTPPIPNIK